MKLIIMAFSGTSIKEICQKDTKPCNGLIDFILFKTYSENMERYISDWTDNFPVE